MSPVSPSSFPVPKAIAWALVCSCKPSSGLPALMAQLKNALMLICTRNVSAAYPGTFLLVGLGLGASCWLVLGMAC